MNKIMNLPEPLLPGIPSAPKGKRFITAAEIDYQRRKRQLAHRLPALQPEDLIGTLEQPFYQTLLRDLMASGYSKVADESNDLLRKEERDRKSSQVKTRMSPVKLIDQSELLQRIADTLKLEQTLLHEESTLAVALDHLAVCRTLSRDQNWQFKPNTILIKLKRPIAFYGIISDDVYEVVDACSMSLYMIASLLEHELLISLANQIMHSPHHKAPTDDDLKNAHEFADLALQLALEVRQPVALSSALTRFGIVLRHVGAYDDAMKYFQQLQHANLIGDAATEAIAFNNMGLCYIGMLNSVNALECFAKQKELAAMILAKELEGNSMHEIGHLLLQEEHLWEAEECYLVAFESFYYAQEVRTSAQAVRKTADHGVVHHDSLNRTDIAWAMAGLAAGQKLWSRLAGLCRSGKSKDLRSVLRFKCGRKPLNAVSRPDYAVQDIYTMPKPWENALDSLKVDDEVMGESSWEEGFMFASKMHLKVNNTRLILKKVGFDPDALDHSLHDEYAKPIPPVNMEAALDELKAISSEAEVEKKKSDFNSQRASQLIEKDMQMRLSLHSAISARASMASLTDKRPTIDKSNEDQ